MNVSPQRRHAREVPEVVRIVLSQLARLRSEGLLSLEAYQEKLERLTREELQPRSMILLERPLEQGGVRYLIKDSADGSVRDLVECGILP